MKIYSTKNVLDLNISLCKCLFDYKDYKFKKRDGFEMLFISLQDMENLENKKNPYVLDFIKRVFFKARKYQINNIVVDLSVIKTLEKKYLLNNLKVILDLSRVLKIKTAFKLNKDLELFFNKEEIFLSFFKEFNLNNLEKVDKKRTIIWHIVNEDFSCFFDEIDQTKIDGIYLNPSLLEKYRNFINEKN